MSTIAKENESLTPGQETTASRPASPTRSDEAASRPQPVALEVPVTVNGVRTVEGSDKREPFSEASKTVLIFGNGAVIRLSSAVTPGQLLFLTNDKTRKEVVCQVVKSKNYRNVSGYVELEFTEPVVGFWGMRFPTDKIASATPAASGASTSSMLPSIAPAKPVAPALPVAPKPEPVVAASAPRISEIKPAPVTTNVPTPAAALPVKPVEPVQATPMAPAVPGTPVAIVPPAPPPAAISPAPMAPTAIELAPLPTAPEVKSAAPVEVKVLAAPPVEDSSEALRQQTARLQEQLSSLLFAEASNSNGAPPATAAVPPVDAAALADSTAKILEFAKLEPTAPAIDVVPAASEPVQETIEKWASAPGIAQRAIPAPPPAKSLLDVDEDVRIPAWLEPLARNATAPTSTQELIEREKAKHIAALAEKPQILEELAAIPLPAAAQEGPVDLQVPNFGSDLPTDQAQFSSEVSAEGSKLPRWLGLIAAVLLISAVGMWYFNQQPNGRKPAPATSSVAEASVASSALASQQQALPIGKSAAAPGVSNAPLNAPANIPASANSSPTGRNQTVQSNPTAPAASVLNANAKEIVRSPEATPAQPQPKKPSLGEVRFSAPTVNRRGDGQNTNEPEPAIEDSNDNKGNAVPSSGLLSGNAKQPSAPSIPLPVGGDVKPAKLIASVPPVYSTLAKTQHISGDVKVDALIDATGHVTTMKVVSGPTLLQQSAMDALRQWRYQPATLDGKDVPMHLTVTIQFRMQ